MKIPTGLIPKAEKFLKKHSPTILTCIGAAGVVATAVLAAKATPKALTLVHTDSRINHDGDPNAYTRKEAVASCWKCYVPAVVVGGSTIACIFGANALNRRQQAALASAYGLVSQAYNDYRRKVRENFGEEAHRDIMRQIAAEKSSGRAPVAPGIIGDSSLEFEGANEELRLFYDSVSERYFQATISQVLQAEYHVNRNFALRGNVMLNEFYAFLDIEPIPGGDDVGWWVDGDNEFYWIDFNHVRSMVDDGLSGEIECYIIDVEQPGSPAAGLSLKRKKHNLCYERR